MYQTLHAHTTASDGKMGYTKLLSVCHKNNLSVVAFTDHDSVIDKNIFTKLKNQKVDIDWISGIEISSGWPLELGGGSTSGLHIVGLFVDPSNANLVEHCRKAKEARVVRMQKMIKNLARIGIVTTEKECLSESMGESVGRPHIVSAIMKRKENVVVIDHIRNDLFIKSKTDPNLTSLYQEIKKTKIEQQPYKLFLSPDSFVKGVYVDYQYYSDFDNSVKLIRDAGGISMLAHWFTCKDKFDAKYLSEILTNKRIDGLETVIGIGPNGIMESEVVNDYYNFLHRMALEQGCLTGGGIDLHSLNELVLFRENSWYANRTKGMVEKILSHNRSLKKWSSIT